MVKNLKLSLLAMAMVAGGSASAQYQLANGTFDGDFVKCYPWEKGAQATKDYGTQPEGWCISNVPNSLAKPMASQVEGKNGKAVKITNTSAMNNGIPAYLTLGTTWATAETRLTSTRNKDGGLFGGVAFTKHPDALKFVYTRDGKDKGDESVVTVYSWKGTWTQADVPSNTAVGALSWGTATKVNMIDRDVNILGLEHILGGTVTKTTDAELIAVGKTTITGSQTDWTEVILPIEYKSNNAPEKINVVFSAAGYQSDASITDGVSITIDDVEFVYNSGLIAQYAGEDITFDENNSATISAEYDENYITLEPDGQAATIASSEYDAETKTLTITVEGENISEDPDNYNVYTIQFGVSDGPQVVDSKTYTEKLYVSVDGDMSEPQMANVVVETLDNGNINFVLKNFVLGAGEESLPVGNIALKNIELNADGTFTFDGGINIEAGDDENYDEEEWLGPMLAMMGEIPLELSGKFVGDDVFVTINIDLVDVMGQMINVHLGYEYVEANMTITDAQFATFCAPMEVDLPDGVIAYSCPQVGKDNVLVLEQVTGNVVPANIPVILYGENPCEENYAEFVESVEEGNPTCGLLTGVYAPAAAPQGSYVLQKQGEKVAFFKVDSDDIMVGANRAYLTAPANVKVLNFSTPATAINAVNALVSGKAEVYGANGARQNGLQKGMNIVKMADGSVQKVLVK